MKYLRLKRPWVRNPRDLSKLSSLNCSIISLNSSRNQGKKNLLVLKPKLLTKRKKILLKPWVISSLELNLVSIVEQRAGIQSKRMMTKKQIYLLIMITKHSCHLSTNKLLLLMPSKSNLKLQMAILLKLQKHNNNQSMSIMMKKRSNNQPNLSKNRFPINSNSSNKFSKYLPTLSQLLL